MHLAAHHTRFPLALLAAICASTVAHADPPHRVQCGSSSYTATDGRVFAADQPYDAGSGFGYVGGSAVATELSSRWFFGGTSDQELVMFGREGNWTYRFDVPNGDHVVTLHGAEVVHHGEGFREIDIQIEGVPVWDDVDMFATALGKDYAVRTRHLVTVTDGELTVTGGASLGEPWIGAIEVVAASPDTSVSPPSNVTAMDGFGRSILLWSHPVEGDVSTIEVERSLDGSSYVPAGESVGWARRYVESSAGFATATTVAYRVRTADVYGNRSAWVEVPAIPVRDVGEGTLPVYALEIDPADLHTLNENVYANEFVPAVFIGDGASFSLSSVHYRGESSRPFHKKSFKIDFGPNIQYRGRTRFNLRSEFGDNSMIRERLGERLATALGVPAPINKAARLVVNGADAGVVGEAENLDELFLQRVGLEEGYLYECIGRLEPLGSLEAYRERYINQIGDPLDVQPIIDLIEDIDTVSDADFPVWAGIHLDVDEILRKYACDVLIANNDFSGGNYYMHLTPSTGRWRFIPWDLDATWRDPTRPIDLGASPSSPDGWGYNRLLRRLLDNETLRHAYVQILIEALAGPFSEAEMFAEIDAISGEIRDAGERDIHKIDYEVNTNFINRPQQLKDFVTDRIAHLEAAIPLFDTVHGEALVVNEVLTWNITGLTDEFGEHDDWVEIANLGSSSMFLGGMGLTDDPTDPVAFTFPPYTLGPGEFVLVWTDGEPAEGAWHAPFRLDKDGETLWLFSSPADGGFVFDEIAWGEQDPDLSWGRSPADPSLLRSFVTMTPGEGNDGSGNLPPAIRDVVQHEPYPPSQVDVPVSARVTDDGLIDAVELVVEIGGVPLAPLAMADDGASGDGDPGDGIYGALIPSAASGIVVSYYVRAEDVDGAVRTRPHDAAANETSRFRYLVDYAPPVIAINEFVASNQFGAFDEFGERDDWIELFNPGPSEVSLYGVTITDDLDVPEKFALDGATIDPGGFLVIWADNDGGQGPLHANFKLAASGEDIGLFAPGPFGPAPVDVVEFGPQSTDVSRGRVPDGAATWAWLSPPTIGTPNEQTVHVDGSPPAWPTTLRVLRNPSRRPLLRLRPNVDDVIRLCVFDVAGRRVGRLDDLRVRAGERRDLELPGRPTLGPGVYFIDVRGSRIRERTRVVVLGR